MMQGNNHTVKNLALAPLFLKEATHPNTSLVDDGGVQFELCQNKGASASLQGRTLQALGFKYLLVWKPPGWMTETLIPHLESSRLMTAENMVRAALDDP